MHRVHVRLGRRPGRPEHARGGPPGGGGVVARRPCPTDNAIGSCWLEQQRARVRCYLDQSRPRPRALRQRRARGRHVQRDLRARDHPAGPDRGAPRASRGRALAVRQPRRERRGAGADRRDRRRLRDHTLRRLRDGADRGADLHRARSPCPHGGPPSPPRRPGRRPAWARGAGAPRLGPIARARPTRPRGGSGHAGARLHGAAHRAVRLDGRDGPLRS